MTPSWSLVSFAVILALEVVLSAPGEQLREQHVSSMSRRRNMFGTSNLNQKATSAVDDCNGEGDDKVWKCRKSKDCGGDSKAQYNVCAYGVETLFCCPPPRPKRAVETTKANTFCEEYMRRTCNETDWENPEDVEEGTQRFIAGGLIVSPEQHPHMALIGYGDDKEWACGGSLISERYVMSAAHCANNSRLGAARWVRLGEFDYSSENETEGTQEFEISERISHPEYNEPLIYNDVALFKLDRDAVFTRTIRPVCLSTMPKVPYTTALATGWGRTGFIEDLSPHLRGVELNTLNITRCRGLSKSARIPNGVLQDRMVCAGDLKGVKDTCQGDSGGPLVIKLSTRCLKTQIGITSFGERCALPDSPGIYTRVSYYVPWIEKIVWP